MLNQHMLKNLKVHKNKSAARTAITQYIQHINQLQNEYGIYDELGDPEAGAFICTQYLDDNNEVWVLEN